jgi:tRNA nucleotidyltransferase/poly(A) polymerase
MKNFKTFLNKKKMELPNDVIEIAAEYKKFGKDIYVVGGAVRDFLSNKIPHDYDLVTNALPEESKHILKNFDVSDEQGKNFGVLRVFTKDEPLGYEIATYRKDISKGRDNKGDDQKVEIGQHITIKDDCMRRDLSINAIFYDIENEEVVDLVGGIDDLKNNIIRCVGDPSERFDEDRLRILRTFRFCARTNGKIDSVTSDAIKKDNRLRGISKIDDVSQERILEEWSKVFENTQKDHKILERYIKLLREYDMWEQMFPKMIISPMNEIRTESKNMKIVFADIFFHNNIRNLKKYMIQELKIKTELYNNIYFLSEFKKTFNDKNVYNLAKLKKQYDIDNDILIEYYGQSCKSFLKYCDDGFIINGLDLIKIGFSGDEIETEKNRLENNRYVEFYKI